jgi:hypothetical protein
MNFQSKQEAVEAILRRKDLYCNKYRNLDRFSIDENLGIFFKHIKPIDLSVEIVIRDYLDWGICEKPIEEQEEKPIEKVQLYEVIVQRIDSVYPTIFVGLYTSEKQFYERSMANKSEIKEIQLVPFGKPM